MVRFKIGERIYNNSKAHDGGRLNKAVYPPRVPATLGSPVGRGDVRGGGSRRARGNAPAPAVPVPPGPSAAPVAAPSIGGIRLQRKRKTNKNPVGSGPAPAVPVPPGPSAAPVATPPIGEIRFQIQPKKRKTAKTKKNRPSALNDIKKYQNSTKLLIPNAPIVRLIRGIMEDLYTQNYLISYTATPAYVKVRNIIW